MHEPVIHEPEHEPEIRERLADGADGPDGADVPLRAAGAVLWRIGVGGHSAGVDGSGSAIEVGLIHRPRYDDWTFPKGKPKGREHLLRTAVREVEEETGLVPRLGRRLPATRYLKDGRVKQVEYWAARAGASGSAGSNGAGFVPNDEVDGLVWLPIREAASRLSYERDIELLNALGALPRRTVPVVVVRHAAARKADRAEDPDDRGCPDALRPLDSRGCAQAVELSSLLQAYDWIERPSLHSSLAARCVLTLIPYALATGARLTTDPAFGPDDDPSAARRRWRGLLAAARPSVVCTHRGLIPELVAETCEASTTTPPDDPDLPKGAFWVAHLAPPSGPTDPNPSSPTDPNPSSPTDPNPSSPTLEALERHTL